VIGELGPRLRRAGLTELDDNIELASRFMVGTRAVQTNS
jgi:hypothetical protein